MLYAIKASLHDSSGGHGELLDTLTAVSGLLKDLEINARWICTVGGEYKRFKVSLQSSPSEV